MSADRSSKEKFMLFSNLKKKKKGFWVVPSSRGLYRADILLARYSTMDTACADGYLNPCFTCSFTQIHTWHIALFLKIRHSHFSHFLIFVLFCVFDALNRKLTLPLLPALPDHKCGNFVSQKPFPICEISHLSLFFSNLNTKFKLLFEFYNSILLG